MNLPAVICVVSRTARNEASFGEYDPKRLKKLLTVLKSNSNRVVLFETDGFIQVLRKIIYGQALTWRFRMARLNELNSYGEELEQRLRLKTFPFAVKLLKEETDIPKGAIRPKRDLGYHLSLCQGFAMSRREGKTVAMFLEDMWCYSPVLALGIAKPPEYYLEGNTYFPTHVGTLELAANLAKNFPRLEYGKCVGVASAPLRKADFKPDMVIIYCDSAQLRSLLAALKYRQGELVTSTMEPASACVQAMVPALMSDRCQIAVPCGGDRKWALAQDDEMIFTLPEEKLADLMFGLRYIDEEGSVFPIKFGARIEYPLSESYIKVGGMIGMEMPE